MNIGIQTAKRIWGFLPLRAALVAWVGLATPAFAQVNVPSLPTIQNGYGTLSVAGSSIALSTVSTSPNSASWKMPLFGNLFVLNSPSSTGILYVCPLGGVCTSSGGIPVAVGVALTLSLGGSQVSPTVISASTSTAVVGW
jgi:hypothetical protein